MSPQQCRAGRGWLGWSQAMLAHQAQVGLSTVRDFERGRHVPIPATLSAMRQALENAGVRLLFQRGIPAGIVRTDASSGPFRLGRLVLRAASASAKHCKQLVPLTMGQVASTFGFDAPLILVGTRPAIAPIMDTINHVAASLDWVVDTTTARGEIYLVRRLGLPPVPDAVGEPPMACNPRRLFFVLALVFLDFSPPN